MKPKVQIWLTPKQLTTLQPIADAVRKAAAASQDRMEDQRGAVLGQYFVKTGTAEFCFVPHEQYAIVKRAIERAKKLDGKPDA